MLLALAAIGPTLLISLLVPVALLLVQVDRAGIPPAKLQPSTEMHMATQLLAVEAAAAEMSLLVAAVMEPGETASTLLVLRTSV